MKMLIHASLAAALFGYACGVFASPTIELKDGSRIQGEIQSLENGVYTVLSPSIGIIHVAQSNIVRIVYGAGASNAADASGKSQRSNDAVTQQIQQVQSRLAEDPAAMQSIMSLQSDPQVQAVLSDPAIMKAIEDGDFMSLLGNAKIQALQNNEHLQQLLQQQQAH